MNDLLLKDAEVIDPAQNIHGRMDIALKGGKIGTIGKNLPEATHNVVYLNGRIVTPGLIDIHCHPSAGLLSFGVAADETGIDSGVVLLCDAGSAGAGNFAVLKRIIKKARTDVLVFINLALHGLEILPEFSGEESINAELTANLIQENPGLIRGIKIRAMQPLADTIGLKAIETAREICSRFRLPLLIHIGDSKESQPGRASEFTRKVVSLMEKGDILSHYVTHEPGGLILNDGTIYPELLEAKKRGVLLDACPGVSHFSFTIAKHALERGLPPDIISTDMTTMSAPPVQSLLVTMSKYLNMGLSIEQVVAMTTINPARAIGGEGGWGSLKKGMPANITVMELVEGDYTFSDGKGGNRMKGSKLLEPLMVIRNGHIATCYSRYLVPPEH